MFAKLDSFSQVIFEKNAKGFFENPSFAIISIILNFYSLIAINDAPPYMLFLVVLGVFSLMVILLAKWKIIKIGKITDKKGKPNPLVTVAIAIWIFGIICAITISIMGFMIGIANIAQLVAQLI